MSEWCFQAVLDEWGSLLPITLVDGVLVGSAEPKGSVEKPQESTERSPVADIPWIVIDRIYSTRSRMTDLKKEEEWPRFEGKRVRWTGKVESISESLDLGVEMNPDTYDEDLEIRLRQSEKSKALELKEGDAVTVEATLAEWGSFPSITLIDGVLIDPNAPLEPKQKRTVRTRRRGPSPKVDDETKAVARLRLAKQMLERRDQIPSGKKRLQSILDDYPGSEAAKEAEELLSEYEQ